MRFEIEEEVEKHDVWGNYIRLNLSDTVNVKKVHDGLMKVLKKYFKRKYKVLKNGSEVKI
ncbi:MAG: hypothetical protein QW424_05345 [Candidatus Bathyarchaeia archaeon]